MGKSLVTLSMLRRYDKLSAFILFAAPFHRLPGEMLTFARVKLRKEPDLILLYLYIDLSYTY